MTFNAAEIFINARQTLKKAMLANHFVSYHSEKQKLATHQFQLNQKNPIQQGACSKASNH